ncbi:hypothetical protein KIW84_023444 [Lathyrus oleraceus]|uniref:Chromo domain-containing protein n=1 Tax=Pisum sativum TaxID=3888 RepID=A0A9D5BBU5_PEA|nr:hypothetical protein KIW84_023444 [Pisum sativum]
MVILNTRWTQTTEPRLEVLVQWQGLHADDTSWEDWETLKGTYHLEDKVLPDELGNDSMWTKEGMTEEAHNDKSKRKIIKPRYLEDYVIQEVQKEDKEEQAEQESNAEKP